MMRAIWLRLVTLVREWIASQPPLAAAIPATTVRTEEDMPIFLTRTGSRLDLTGNHYLKRSYVLQRYRDVWSVAPKYPYLCVDEERVNGHANELRDFPVFVSGFLVQNLSREDFGQRMMASLFSPGITGGFSPTSGVLVEGRANPKAHDLITSNDPLYIGMHPYAALGTKYIFVEQDHLFQHTVGTLVTVNKHSRPRSAIVDFDRLADLQLELFQTYLGKIGAPNLKDTSDLELQLDAIFVENEKILAAMEAHHRSLAPHTAAYDYEAPVLTKYGRLAHDQSGVPRIEISYALLHYETALHEFDNLKKATAAKNVDAAFMHGVSCVVSAAACLEAIANRLVYIETGAHPTFRDRRQPIPKINDSCAILASRAGGTFSPLQAGQTAHDELEALRIHRNSLMHAKELESDLEPTTRQSMEVVASGEAKCRLYLMNLRLGVAQIFAQLPQIPAPIETRQNVTWLGDLEVP